MNLAGGIFGCCVLNKLDISTNGYLETLRPLVAPSLRSGSLQPRALGSLNNLEPLVSMSNYYLCHSEVITLGTSSILRPHFVHH